MQLQALHYIHDVYSLKKASPAVLNNHKLRFFARVDLKFQRGFAYLEGAFSGGTVEDSQAFLVLFCDGLGWWEPELVEPQHESQATPSIRY